MRGVSVVLRRLIGGRTQCFVPRSSSIGDTLFLSSIATASCSPLLIAGDDKTRPLLTSPVTAGPVANFRPTLFRSFSSSPSSSDPSKIVVIESAEQFDDSLRKVQDESLPAIFYFTAVWCGPCRLLSPVIGQLSEKYPHVTTYKVDIDQEGLGKALSKLNINAVPTLHFFQNGKKAGEVVGADVEHLKDTMEALYK